MRRLQWAVVALLTLGAISAAVAAIFAGQVITSQRRTQVQICHIVAELVEVEIVVAREFGVSPPHPAVPVCPPL